MNELALLYFSYRDSFTDLRTFPLAAAEDIL